MNKLYVCMEMVYMYLLYEFWKGRVNKQEKIEKEDADVI